MEQRDSMDGKREKGNGTGGYRKVDVIYARDRTSPQYAQTGGDTKGKAKDTMRKGTLTELRQEGNHPARGQGRSGGKEAERTKRGDHTWHSAK